MVSIGERFESNLVTLAVGGFAGTKARAWIRLDSAVGLQNGGREIGSNYSAFS